MNRTSTTTNKMIPFGKFFNQEEEEEETKKQKKEKKKEKNILSHNKKDPLCFTKESGIALILGVSTSGKTELVKACIKKNFAADSKKKNFSKKLYIINSLKNEYSNICPNLETIHLLLADHDNIEDGSYVVVEDILGLKPADDLNLRQILNYKVHHNFLKMFLVSHNIFKTSIYSLLGYFAFIIITGNKSNIPLIRNLLNYFKFEKKEILDCESHILNKKKEIINDYYILSSTEKKIYYVSSIDDIFQEKFFECNKFNNNSEITKLDKKNNNSIESLKNIILERFNFLLAGYKKKLAAASLVSILLNYIDLSKIRIEDLTLKEVIHNKKKSYKLPILDYLHCILSTKQKPTKEMLYFHQYISSKCNLPTMYINNIYIKKFINLQ